MPVNVFDISTDNFEFYFENQLRDITDAQKELIPPDLLHKALLRGGGVDEKSTRKMPFLAKLFLLFKVFKKRCIIIIEDEEKGLTEDQFLALKKKTIKHDFGEKNAGRLITHSMFVLGNKDLCDTYHRLSLLSASPAYNYLVAAKNKDYTKPGQWLAAINYVNRFLSHYEANRKRISLHTGLNMPEWLILIHLYNGNLIPSSSIYKEWYKHSFNASSTKFKSSFGTLQALRYIEKVGATKSAKIRITALGKDKVNEILKKHIDDWDSVSEYWQEVKAEIEKL